MRKIKILNTRLALTGVLTITSEHYTQSRRIRVSRRYSFYYVFVPRDSVTPPESYVRGSGGIFLDMMIHDIDMLRFLSGSDVEEVCAIGNVLVDKYFADAGDVDTSNGDF